VHTGGLVLPARALLRSRLAMAITIAAAIIGSSTVGLATAVTTGLIYACVNNGSGTIKVVSAQKPSIAFNRVVGRAVRSGVHGTIKSIQLNRVASSCVIEVEHCLRHFSHLAIAEVIVHWQPKQPVAGIIRHGQIQLQHAQ